MDREDLPMISPAEPSAPSVPRPKIQTVRKDPEKARLQPQGRESQPTERVEVVSSPDADIHALAELPKQLERALKDLPRIIRDRDNARARVAELEHELAQAREQISALKSAEERAREAQGQVTALQQARETTATELAQAKERIATLKLAEDRARDLDGLVKELKHGNATTAADLTEARAHTVKMEGLVHKKDAELQEQKTAREAAEKKLDAVRSALGTK